MNNLISVIVTIYNKERYIEDLIESIINQTYKNIEIIIVNDGSLDNSQKILEKYTLIDKRIRLFNNKNRGSGYAKNYGMDKATGKYIIFVDGDDKLSYDWIEKLYVFSEKDQLDIGIGDTLQWYPNNENKNFIIPKKLDKNLIEKGEILYYYALQNNSSSMTAWDKIYNLKFLRKNEIRFMENNKFDDMRFSIFSYLNAQRVKYIPGVNYYYRQELESSITGNINAEKVEDFYKEIKYFIKEKNSFKEKIKKKTLEIQLLRFNELMFYWISLNPKIEKLVLTRLKIRKSISLISLLTMKTNIIKKIRYLFLYISPKMYLKIKKSMRRN